MPPLISASWRRNNAFIDVYYGTPAGQVGPGGLSTLSAPSLAMEEFDARRASGSIFWRRSMPLFTSDFAQPSSTDTLNSTPSVVTSSSTSLTPSYSSTDPALSSSSTLSSTDPALSSTPSLTPSSTPALSSTPLSMPSSTDPALSSTLASTGNAQSNVPSSSGASSLMSTQSSTSLLGAGLPTVGPSPVVNTATTPISSTNTGAIIGSVIGGIVFFLLLIILFFVMKRYKKKKVGSAETADAINCLQPCCNPQLGHKARTPDLRHSSADPEKKSPSLDIMASKDNSPIRLSFSTPVADPGLAHRPASLRSNHRALPLQKPIPRRPPPVTVPLHLDDFPRDVTPDHSPTLPTPDFGGKFNSFDDASFDALEAQIVEARRHWVGSRKDTSINEKREYI